MERSRRGPSADSLSCWPRLCSHNKQPAILTDQRFFKTAQVKTKTVLLVLRSLGEVGIREISG